MNEELCGTCDAVCSHTGAEGETCDGYMPDEQEIKEQREKYLNSLPWWRKDYLGWPIETFKGKPVLSFIRIVCQNIRKIKGLH